MRRGLLAYAAAVAAVVGLAAGCSSTSSTSPTSSAAAESSTVAASAASSAGPSTADQHFVIGYAGAVQSNPNNKAVEDGIKSQAESLGMDVIVTDANLDPNKQIADVESLVQQGVNALIVWPLDPKGIQPALDKARAAGIPIIVQDTPDAGDVASNFEVNNFETAQAAAALVATKVPSGAKVAVIQGIPAVNVLAARNQGFADGAKAAGLDVVAEQVNDKDNADGARPIVDAWKSKFGADLKGILAYNDPSALGAASASGGDFAPVVVGINGDADGVAAVKDGRLLATYDFRPVELGNGLAWGAHELLTGKSLPATVNVEMTLIDSSNAGSWKPIDERLSAPMSVSIDDRDGESYLAVQ